MLPPTINARLVGSLLPPTINARLVEIPTGGASKRAPAKAVASYRTPKVGSQLRFVLSRE